MPSAIPSRIPIPHPLIVALTCALLVLVIAASAGSAQEAPDSGGSSSGSPVSAVSTSPATSTPVTTDGGDAPDEDDVVLVLGYTAATVLGLAVLALLDRKPEPIDHESDEE